MRMVEIRKLCAALIFAGLAICPSACVNGTAAFQQYQLAFEAQNSVADDVLDRLAASERIVQKRQRGPAASRMDFDPNLASYYVSVGDPPLTAYIRGSIEAVDHYNKTLAALASGQSAQQLTAGIGAAATAAAGAAQAVGGLTGIVGPAFAATADASLAPILPVLQQLVSIRDRAVFREQLLAHYPDVEALLKTIRDEATPEIFYMIKRSYVVTGSLAPGTGGIPAADLPRLDQDRQALAGWVILLDRTLVAMSAAVAAANQKTGPDLQTLTENAIELRVLAETLKAAR